MNRNRNGSRSGRACARNRNASGARLLSAHRVSDQGTCIDGRGDTDGIGVMRGREGEHEQAHEHCPHIECDHDTCIDGMCDTDGIGVGAGTGRTGNCMGRV